MFIFFLNFRSFRHRVNYNNKQNVFTAEGKFTFFIPVDEGFQVTNLHPYLKILLNIFIFLFL